MSRLARLSLRQMLIMTWIFAVITAGIMFRISAGLTIWWLIPNCMFQGACYLGAFWMLLAERARRRRDCL